MNVLEGLAGLRQLPAGAVISIGNFDGMHLGHRCILRMAEGLRDGQAPPSRRPVAIVTFEPHPLTVLRPELAPPRLTPLAMKKALLAEAGVDELVILPPTGEVLDLSAQEFLSILRDEVRPAHLIEGKSFTFGKGRAGTIQTLKDWSAASEIKLHIPESSSVPLLDLQIAPVSSSLIRWLLGHGRVRDAAICLGRAYALEGTVVQGLQRGRTLGVPTANLNCDDQMIPGEGVYAGRCKLGKMVYPAAINIGPMPTFNDSVHQVEAHLVGFDGDLYGQLIRVELLDWLRDQVKFSGVIELKRQLAMDIEQTRHRAGNDAARPIGMSA